MEKLKVEECDILDPIKGKEQQIINCFVQFFGEENRDIIIERFNNITSLFIPKSCNEYDALLKVLESIKKKENNQYLEKFYDSIGYNYQKVLNRTFLIEFVPLLKNKIENGNLSNSDYKILGEVLFCKFNVPLNKNGKEIVDAWLMSAKDKKLLISTLDDMYNKWKQSEFRSEYFNKVSEINTIIIKIEEIKNFNLQESNLAREEIKEIILNKFSEIKNVSKERILKDPNIEKYVEHMKKIALNSRTSFLSDDWIDSELERDIELYKFLGFDYGFKYDDYLDDQKLIDGILNIKFINEIQEVWARHSETIINNDIFLKYAFDKINNIKFYCNKGYVLKEIVDASVLSEESYASTLNVFNDRRELINVCIFDSPLMCGDDTYIHETCHALSSLGEISKDLEVKLNVGVSLVKFTDKYTNNFTFKDLLTDYGLEDSSSMGVMLNEVLTDYFSYKIQDIFRQNNLQVCKGKNELSFYARMFGMMQDLIENNIEIFKKAYITGDVSELVSIMSVQDIKTLSELLDGIFVKYSQSSFKHFEKEIKEKTNLTDNLLYNVKQYIDKDLDWSSEIKEFFEYYKKIDLIEENIKIKQNKFKNNEKIN